jgi:hypothetical protein
MEAFRALIHQKRVHLKICFLVDGLDEFDGDHEEIVEIFREISQFRHIKVCLSSRPLVIFQDLLENCPGLCPQSLTYPDIKRYVRDKQGGSSAFRRLAKEEKNTAPALVHEIVEKADGVFLWVKLVVRSLLDGIRNRDEMSHLWERLRLLPRELEPLYSRLLGMVEPIYLVWVSKSFQLLRNNRDLGEFPFPEASVGTTGVGSLNVLAFYLAMNSDFDEAKIEKLHKKGLFNAKCKDITVQLTARCAGLLEVANVNGTGTTGPKSFIQYFHRTARDFLHTDVYWSKIQVQTRNTNFNPNVSMMQSCILQTLLHYKCYQEPRSRKTESNTSIDEDLFAEVGTDGLIQKRNMDKKTTALVKDFMVYAYNADRQSETTDVQIEMIDSFNNLLCGEMDQYNFPELIGFCHVFGACCYVRSSGLRQLENPVNKGTKQSTSNKKG